MSYIENYKIKKKLKFVKQYYNKFIHTNKQINNLDKIFKYIIEQSFFYIKLYLFKSRNYSISNDDSLFT